MRGFTDQMWLARIAAVLEGETVSQIWPQNVLFLIGSNRIFLASRCERTTWQADAFSHSGSRCNCPGHGPDIGI